MADFEEILRNAGRTPEEAAALGSACVTRSDIDTLIGDFRAKVVVAPLFGKSIGTIDQQKAVQIEEAHLLSGKGTAGDVSEKWEGYFDVKPGAVGARYWETPVVAEGATVSWNELHRLTIPAEENRPALAMSDAMDRWAERKVAKDGFVVSDNSKYHAQDALAGKMQRCNMNLSSNDSGLETLRHGDATNLSEDDRVTPLPGSVAKNSRRGLT